MCFSTINYAQTLVFPLTNGGEKDQGSLLMYDFEDGANQSLFFNHEIEKSDHNNTGSSSRQSKGVFVSSTNSIYYTFADGGTHAYDAIASGHIVKYDLTTQEFYVVRSFSILNYEDGTHPTSGLTEYNGKLYGVCRGGGNNEDGVIYYIDLADDSYHIVHHFNEATDGATPTSSLILENNKLYGGTERSTDGEGHVLFEFDPANNNYSVLFDRTGWGELEAINDVIFRNGLLYFCSEALVGFYNFNTNSTTILHQSNGSSDVLGFFYTGFNFASNVGKYYVTASGGGVNSKGAILEVNGSMPYLVNVRSFGAFGTFPQQELIDLGNGKQVGVTLENASNINGSLFEFSATNIETPIFSFPNPDEDGFRISGIPVLANNSLYGFADEGGANGAGVFYEYNFATLTYTKLKDLGSTIGRAPIGAIIQTDNDDYIGINARGGTQGYGTIFTTDFTDATGVYDNINNNSIERFETNLVFYNGLYYGVGIPFNPSSVESFSILYSYDPNSNSITTVAAIDPSGIPGVALPTSIAKANLLYEADKLYGFTNSKIFEYDLISNTLTYPHAFNTNTDGNITEKAEINNGMIYGVNINGGINAAGTIFKFDIGSSSYTVLESFTGTTGLPINLGLFGDMLYGITSLGGTNSVGSVFKYDLINDTYSTIHDLELNEGYYRGAKLFLASDNNLYGSLDEGGQNGFGSIIKINTTNDDVTFPFHFSTSTGNTTLRSMITEVCIPPATPTGDSNQSFAEGATIEDIVVNPTDVSWFLTESDAINLTNELLPGTILIDGQTYWAVNIGAQCSSAPFPVTVDVCSTPNIPTGDIEQNLPDGSTLADIVINPTDVTWFATESDALNNTNPLPIDTILVDGETYWAISIDGLCFSNPIGITIFIILNTTDFNQDNLKIYPNPVNEILYLNVNNYRKIEIYSISGVLIKEFNENNIIEVEGLDSGIYLIYIYTDNNFYVEKFIKK